MLRFTLILAAAALSGCATLGLDGKQLENALAPALACDKTFMVSQYGPWGITSKLRDADHEELRKLLPRCNAAATPAAAASAAK